jgi:hypothetical protein
VRCPTRSRYMTVQGAGLRLKRSGFSTGISSKKSGRRFMTCLAKRDALGLRFPNLAARDDGSPRPGVRAHEWFLGARRAGDR